MIIVLGIGPGDPNLRLSGTGQYIENADIVIGSLRQLETLSVPDDKAMKLPHLADLKTFLKDNLEQQIVLLASGDPLLYGIGTWITNNFEKSKVQIVPGISSIQYMFHQLRLAMNDSYLTSSHGRIPDFDFLLQHDKIGMVTDTDLGPVQIAQEISQRGQHRHIYVGENLSYSNERISHFTESNVEDRPYDLNVVIITNA